MALVWGALADDLTGGMELAAMLVAAGVRCGFATSPAAAQELTGLDALVIGLKTRVAPAAEAVARFREAAAMLQAGGARQLFFKYCATFDSTDLGNIGPCADVLMGITGARQTAFCPTFPEVGRRVFQGHLFTGDTLVSESPKRFDPLTPMLDPSLVRTLRRQTATPVGLLPHEVVRTGVRAMRRHLAAETAAGRAYFIADSAVPDDLQALAELTFEWPLMTGGSSIAAYYPACWRRSGWLPSQAPAPSLPAVHGPGVVLAGSCADRTLEQLRAFGQQRPVLWIDMERAVDGSDVVAGAVRWALEHLASGPVAIATSAPPADVQRIQARAGRQGAAALAEAIHGQLAVMLRDAGVRRFVVSGGETAGSVMEHLGIAALDVGAYEAPGIARAVTRDAPRLALCLKSGKLGPVDMLLPMLQSMEY